MKKMVTILFLMITVIALSGNYFISETSEDHNAKIYYVDHSMLRLVPVDYNITNATVQKACEKIIEKIIDGEDYNNNILRVVPKIKNGMDVEVDDEIAYVNFKNDFIENIPNNNIHEVLMVYSIVNSLTSVEGVNVVKFLFDGEEKKEYIGGMDMRETFIPDYYI